MDKLNKPYWSYETIIGNDNQCVSVRAYKKVKSSDYYNYLGKFISALSLRISSVDESIKFMDGSYCTIIRLSGDEVVVFNDN